MQNGYHQNAMQYIPLLLCQQETCAGMCYASVINAFYMYVYTNHSMNGRTGGDTVNHIKEITTV